MSKESENNDLKRVEALNVLYSHIKQFTKDGKGFTYGVDHHGQQDSIGEERLRMYFKQSCLEELSDFHASFAREFNIVLQVNFPLRRLSLPKTDIPTLEAIEKLISDLIVVSPDSFVNPPMTLTISKRI